MRSLIILLVVITNYSIGQVHPAERQTQNISLRLDESSIEVGVYRQQVNFRPRPDCEYHWWRAQEIHQTYGGYSGKLLHGSYKEYYKDNALKASGQFIKGLKYGEWKEWHNNGKLRAVSRWKRGRLHGIFKEFSTEGELIKSVKYKQGEQREPRVRKNWFAREKVDQNVKEDKKVKELTNEDKKSLTTPGLQPIPNESKFSLFFRKLKFWKKEPQLKEDNPSNQDTTGSVDDPNRSKKPE